MTYKNYSKNELKTLLQQTQQEVISKLLNPFDQNNQYYYENFASITIKIFKYVNHFLNQINSDQDFGKLIDSIIKNLAESLNEYKSRNIFMHSTYTQESENRNQDDEIYHFMNTRNNNIPAQCLNNYESQKQRIELQQFVQEMSKHTKYNFKQQKRSLMLPNENSSKLKLGRKATFDTELRSIKQQKIESKTFLSFQEHQKQEQITRNHIQIQTDFTIIQEEYKKTKTLEAYTQCQCESLPIFQKASQSLPNRKELIWNKKKKQPKKDLKGKKKVKTTNNPSSISLKEPIQDFNEYQKQYKQQYPSKIQCTIKDVNLILNITKEVDLTVFDCQINDIFQYQNSPVTPSVDENYINNENNMFLNDQFSQNIEEMVIRYQKTIQSQKDDEQQYKTQTHQNLSQDQQIQKQINLLQQNNKKTSVQITQRQVQQQKIKSKIYYDEIKISNNDDISKKISKEHTQNRRIPSPTVKIVEAYQIQKKAQFNQQNFPSKHNQITRNQNKISKKKKIFTSSLNFHTSIQTIQNESQKSKDIHSIKKSNFNTDEASKIYKNRKESNKQNHKYSILAKNSISNISEIPSQQYLISRQKSAQIRLNNPNLDIIKNQIKDQQPKNRLEKETNNKQQIVKSKTSNNSKLSGYISRLNQNQHQIVNNSLMIFFSKKPKILQLNQTQPRIQTLIQGQNDRSSSSFYRQNLLSHKGKQSNRKNVFNSVDEICKTPQKFNIYERNIINLKKYREKECKTVDPATASPKRSIFHHKSSAITPIKTAMSKLRQEARQVNTSQSHHKNFIYSKSQHQDSQNFEFDELKRKLRNRTNKDKLSHYLELIQATHIKFCGNNCEHITQLLKEKDGQVSQQILRLFKRIK